MPRPRFSNRLIADTFTLAAAQSVSIVIDFVDSFYPQVMVKVTYPVTGSPAGVTCTVFPGFAVDNLQTVEFVDNGDVITEFATTAPLTGQSSPQIKRTGFGLNPEVYPRYLNMVLTNTDTANAVQIRIVGDW